MQRSELRWVVQPGQVQLSDVLRALGSAAESALADGRVFVNRKRASTTSTPVTPGDLVEVQPGRRIQGHGQPLAILLQTRDFLVVDKPAALATEPDRQSTEASVRARLAIDLSTPKSELHAVSRLDVGVSGVVVFARTPKGRAELSELKTRGGFERTYVGIAAKPVTPPSGEWRMPIAAKGRGEPALSRYRTVATTAKACLLALEPVTGRTHQLRLHCSGAGAPLWGDRRYGGPTRLTTASGAVKQLDRIALHSARVCFTFAGREVTAEAPIPDALRSFWRELAGNDDAWTRAW